MMIYSTNPLTVPLLLLLSAVNALPLQLRCCDDSVVSERRALELTLAPLTV